MFVQGERRDQVYLDYAEPQPIFVQASAEPNLFGLCRVQPKMSRKGACYMNEIKAQKLSLHECKKSLKLILIRPRGQYKECLLLVCE